MRVSNVIAVLAVAIGLFSCGNNRPGGRQPLPMPPECGADRVVTDKCFECYQECVNEGAPPNRPEECAAICASEWTRCLDGSGGDEGLGGARCLLDDEGRNIQTGQGVIGLVDPSTDLIVGVVDVWAVASAWTEWVWSYGSTPPWRLHDEYAMVEVKNFWPPGSNRSLTESATRARNCLGRGVVADPSHASCDQILTSVQYETVCQGPVQGQTLNGWEVQFDLRGPRSSPGTWQMGAPAGGHTWAARSGNYQGSVAVRLKVGGFAMYAAVPANVMAFPLPITGCLGTDPNYANGYLQSQSDIAAHVQTYHAPGLVLSHYWTRSEVERTCSQDVNTGNWTCP